MREWIGHWTEEFECFQRSDSMSQWDEVWKDQNYPVCYQGKKLRNDQLDQSPADFDQDFVYAGL